VDVATYYIATIIASRSMTITALTSSQFNQDTSGAKKPAQHWPVFITDRGKPAHVLMTIEQYQHHRHADLA